MNIIQFVLSSLSNSGFWVLFVYYVELHHLISDWLFDTRSLQSQYQIHSGSQALISITLHYFKRSINSPTSHVSDSVSHQQETWTAATRGSSERNTRSMRGLFLKTSRVVLQPEEEMIYVDLISPLWWQTYDQMINGQQEKQENYWRDL